MSAKSVSNGAIFAASGEGEIADLSVGPGGSILVDCSHDEGRGEVTVVLAPERAALLARAVLEAQGWLFSKDGRCGGELLRFPSSADPGGLGDEMAQLLARTVLEQGGWEFGPEGEDVDPVTAVRPGRPGSAERLRNLESYALGILADALRSRAASERVRQEMIGLLTDHLRPEPPTEKAH